MGGALGLGQTIDPLTGMTLPMNKLNEAGVQATEAEGEELFETLEKSISQLDADEREILRLAYFEGVTQKNMADKLHTSAKAIESRLGRIRQKLRRILLENMRDYALF
jgi:RNA polymerase sigma factor (sigma-70 family)